MYNHFLQPIERGWYTRALSPNSLYVLSSLSSVYNRQLHRDNSELEMFNHGRELKDSPSILRAHIIEVKTSLGCMLHVSKTSHLIVTVKS